MARSMMLHDLDLLLRALPIHSSPEEYAQAVVQDNVLGKPTYSSRRKSLRHLHELFGLDPRLTLFRVMRTLVLDDPASLPLLALVCAFCRDAQLRQSFQLILDLPQGAVLPRAQMEQHLEAGYPGRFSAAMKKSLAQNVLTTWTDSGHLSGHSNKCRTLPAPTMAASVFAMLAGYLAGLRGEILLGSVFSSLVAPNASFVQSHLSSASGRGWLRFRRAGGVVEIDFTPLLTSDELELLLESH